MTKSLITDDMRSILGRVFRESISYPISVADIRKWAMAVYHPEVPPRLYWDEAYATTTKWGGIIAPDEFNPFAWMTEKPAADDPPVSRTGFSERELGIEPPPYRAMLLTNMNARHTGVPMRPGDVITATRRITDYFEREGRMGLMLYTTVADELTNQDGALVRTNELVFARY